MAEREPVTAQDDQGNKYFIPDRSFRVSKVDGLARVLAAGSLALNGVLAGKMIYDSTTTPDSSSPKLAKTVEVLKEELEKNLLGDCINENVLRTALGVAPADMATCEAEREEWFREENIPPGRGRDQ